MPVGFNAEDKYYQMGKINEKRFLPILKEHIDPTLQIIENTKSVIDYSGEKCWVELKSRNCYSYSFPTTMFGANKIKAGFSKIDGGLRVFYAFAFTNGLYIWELTRTSYEEVGGDACIKMGGTTKMRGEDDYKLHFFLDTNFLKKISDVGADILAIPKKNTSLTGKCYITHRGFA